MPYISILLVFIFLTLFLIQKRFEYRKKKIEHYEKTLEFLNRVRSFILKNTNDNIFQIESGFLVYFGQKMSVYEIHFLLHLNGNALYFFENYLKVKEYLKFDNSLLSITEKFTRKKKYIWIAFYVFSYIIFALLAILFTYSLFKIEWSVVESIQVILLSLSALGIAIMSMHEGQKIVTASKLVELCR